MINKYGDDDNVNANRILYVWVLAYSLLRKSLLRFGGKIWKRRCCSTWNQLAQLTSLCEFDNKITRSDTNRKRR